MAEQIWANNATSLVTGTFLTAATSMTFTLADDALFPNPTAGQYFICSVTMVDGSYEIIKVTTHTAATGTFGVVERAQEGTAALDVTAGDVADGVKVELINSAAAMTDMARLAQDNAFTGANTHAGTEIFNDAVTLAAAVELGDTVVLTGRSTPAQITTDENDYTPTDFATSSVLRISSDAAWSITGLTGGADGRVVTLLNVGSFNITLEDEGAGSTAANRFAFPEDVTLFPDESVELWYDAVSSRWRLKSRVQVDTRTWQAMTGLGGRAEGADIQNTSGRAIEVKVVHSAGVTAAAASSSLFVGATTGTYVTVQVNVSYVDGTATETQTVSAIVPNGWYYKTTNGNLSISSWHELR